MNISLHKLISTLAISVLMLGVHSCDNPLAQSSQTSHLPISKEPNMVKVIYPSLRLVSNSSTALLDKVNQGFQVYTLPDIHLRFSQDSYQDVVNVVLSSSGQAIGVYTNTNELVLVNFSPPQRYKLPRNRETIRSLAISDAGDKVAILLVDNRANVSSVEENGVLEIWSLPLGDRPLASIKLSVFDSGTVSANGLFSSFAVQSTASVGNQQFTGIYQYAQATGTLSPVKTEEGDFPKWIAVALYNNWVWTVQADAIVGWQQNTTPIKLLGTPREHLIYSPTGSHLLAYRGEESINVTSQKILFRLFDLSSLKEVKRATHVIDDRSNAQFVLSKELSVLELRTTRNGEIKIQELAWQPQAK